MDPARKLTKGKGVDGEASRRVREDKAVQIRKDKRLDRANLQRRRYQEEEEEEEAKKPKNRLRARRNLETMPQRAAELHSDDVEIQIDAATYFRKVLAIDKFPPVDMVVASGAVPRLVQFLARYDCPKLQLESAWAITNIACGEVSQASVLVENGAIPLLIDLIANSRDDAVREQALWALGNISSDVLDCRDMLINGGIVQPLLWQLGINSPPHRKVESPSLSTMRHVTWTCSNLAKGSPPPPIEALRMIVFALAELVQSPDEEMLSDACNGLAMVCEQGAEAIQLLLEQGLVGRMCELCEGSRQTREAALLVLSGVLRSPLPLHRKIVLSGRYVGILRTMVTELSAASSDKTRIDITQALRTVMETESKYIPQLLALGLLEVLSTVIEKGVFELNVQAGHCLCLFVTTCSTQHLPSISASVLPHLQEFLSSTEPTLLVAVLLALRHIVVCITQAGLTLPAALTGCDVRDRIGLLANHPFAEIATHAAELETLMDTLDFSI